MYIARVKAKHKEAILMYGCYVEEVLPLPKTQDDSISIE